MKTFKSIAALEAAAKASARKTLNYQVKDLVEKKIREKAQEVVYSVCSPRWFGYSICGNSRNLHTPYL